MHYAYVGLHNAVAKGEEPILHLVCVAVHGPKYRKFLKVALKGQNGVSMENKYNSDNKWYKLRAMLGYTWATFYILIGARECGKSFSVLDYFLHEFFKKGKPFFWLRLKDTQIKKLLSNKCNNFFDSLLVEKHNIDHSLIKVNGNTVHYDGRLMCKILAVDMFYNDKGVAHFNPNDIYINEKKDLFTYNICLDEFQREKRESNTFDVGYAFVNQLENLVRHRTDARIFLLGNTVEDVSDILQLFNFIPMKIGIYKLKSKKAVIQSIPASEAYLNMRKGSIANLLMPQASTFTNTLRINTGLVKKPAIKPLYIIQFPNRMYTVFENEVVCRYNKENKPIIAMGELLDLNTPFKKELFKTVMDAIFLRKYYFEDYTLQKMFEKDAKELRRR